MWGKSKKKKKKVLHKGWTNLKMAGRPDFPIPSPRTEKAIVYWWSRGRGDISYFECVNANGFIPGVWW